MNRPIIRDRLAIRASAMYEEKSWVRKPSVDRTNRQNIQVSFRPFNETLINASYERYHEFAQRPNSIMPREGVTYWRDQGSPTYAYDNATNTGTFTINGVKQAPVSSLSSLPAGIGKFGTNNIRNFAFVDGGVIQFLEKGGSGNNNNTLQLLQATIAPETRPLWKTRGSTDGSVYDWKHLNLAAPNYETNRADLFNVSLQQTVFRTGRQQMFFEAAWRREDQLNYRRMFIAQQDGVGNTILVDVNEKLPDGRPNPFVGRPFIGGVQPQVNIRPNFTDNYRAQLAYELDLRREKSWLKWFGMHRLNGYGEYRVNIASPGSLRYRDQIVDNTLFTGAVTSTTNLTSNNGLQLYPLFYLGNTKGGGVEYANTGPTNWNGVMSASTFTGKEPTWTWTRDEKVTVKETYFAMGMQKKKVRTQGGSIQSFLWGDRILPTYGRRRDRVYTEDNLGLTLDSGLYDLENLYNFGANKKWRFGDTTTKGVVVKPFRGWKWIDNAANGSGISRWAAQTLRGFSAFYSKSDSFKPEDAAYNVFLQQLPNPTGRSEEYGFNLSMFEDKFNMRLTHQETIQFHTRSGVGTIAARAMSIDFDVPGQTRPFDLYHAAIDWQTELHPDFNQEQINEAAAKQIGYTTDFISSVSGKTIADVSDATSKGWELELQFNPTRYWTVRMTGNQQVAMDTNVSLFLQEYIAQRLPYWTTVKDPADNLWWKTFEGTGTNDSPETYFTNLVQQPFNLTITTQGKRKPQTREYRTSIMTKYQLQGLGTGIRFLNSSAVGGTFRWSSKGAIGYYAAAPDPDGVVRSLDKTKPYYDKPEGNLDLMYSYTTRLFRNKVRASFQLNVRNVTEGGRVKGVAVNPDGEFWQYRIIEPRQYIFSASFDL